MKTLTKLFCMLAVAGFCLSGAALPAEGQSIVGPGYTKLQQTASYPWQLAGDWKFNSSSVATPGFDVRGISYYRILWVPSAGFSGTCALSLDSASAVDTNGNLVSPVVGGILAAGTIGSCASAGEYLTTTAAGISAYGQITPTVTGAGSVIVIVFGYTENPSAASAVTANAGTGTFNVNWAQLNSVALGSPSVYGTSPGAVNVPGVNAYITNTVPVSGTFWQTTQPVSGTFWQTTQPVSLATAPTTPTQPAGFSSSPLGAQVAVTATATALASNSTHQVCAYASPNNTIPIYEGGSGVTTSTGFWLYPGDFFCWSLTNSNLMYFIASTTGASLAWTAQ